MKITSTSNPYDKVVELVEKPDFSMSDLKNNPLALTDEELAARQRRCQNIRVLNADAEMKNNPATGFAYRAITGMRYGG